MNISGFSTCQAQSFRMMDCGNRTGAQSFSDLLSGAGQQAQSPIQLFLFLPKENTVYSGGRGTQMVYAEYTSASTPEDPVVRIKGQATGGGYEFTRHINDIDPACASYAELCALWGHLKASGQSSIELGYPYTPVLPYGIDTGDVTQKRNYASLIQGMTTSTVFDASNQLYAKELLELYLNWKNAG